jgi:hypothetical protein
MAPQGRCPTCGQLIGSRPGRKTPVHSLPDSPSKKCPGGTTVPM